MNIWLAIINQELNLKIIGLNLCFLVKKKKLSRFAKKRLLTFMSWTGLAQVQVSVGKKKKKCFCDPKYYFTINSNLNTGPP